MFSEKFYQPIVYMCRYVQLGYFVQKGGVSYGIKHFTKVQRDDIDYTEACLIVMVCSRYMKARLGIR